MSAQHTPGRLKVFSAYATPEIRTQDDAFVANTSPYNEANARRLVACWNACEGIDTEYLEGDESLPHYARRLMTQRDELLAALKQVRGEVQYMASGMTHSVWRTKQAQEAMANIDAAIAKVEGGAA